MQRLKTCSGRYNHQRKKKKKKTTKTKQKTKRSVANMSCIFMTRKSYFTSSSKYVMYIYDEKKLLYVQ